VLEVDGEIAGVVVNELHQDHLLLDTVAVAPGAQGTAMELCCWHVPR
jgi:hypothetical protein